jgi:hypothetical protein
MLAGGFGIVEMRGVEFGLGFAGHRGFSSPSLYGL